jgi:hypothetical protein
MSVFALRHVHIRFSAFIFYLRFWRRRNGMRWILNFIQDAERRFFFEEEEMIYHAQFRYGKFPTQNFWVRRETADFLIINKTCELPKACGAEAFCTFWIGNVLRATTGSLFQHFNIQKCSECGVLWRFWVPNVLRATTACNCSPLIWPAGSAPAALASLLLDVRSPKSLEKQSVSRLSYLFAHLHLLSSDSFSSTLLSSNLSLLSASALLCFSSVHIVGSLTSKLPSTIFYCKSYISM